MRNYKRKAVLLKKSLAVLISLAMLMGSIMWVQGEAATGAVEVEPFSTVNLINNGNFAEGLDGWTVTGNSENEPYVDAAGNLVIPALSSGATDAGVTQDLNLQPNRTYRVEINGRITETPPDPDATGDGVVARQTVVLREGFPMNTDPALPANVNRAYWSPRGGEPRVNWLVPVVNQCDFPPYPPPGALPPIEGPTHNSNAPNAFSATFLQPLNRPDVYTGSSLLAGSEYWHPRIGHGFNPGYLFPRETNPARYDYANRVRVGAHFYMSPDRGSSAILTFGGLRDIIPDEAEVVSAVLTLATTYGGPHVKTIF